MAQTTEIIDVSHWQKEIDFARVKAEGVLGVIAKATEGTSYVDEYFVSNRAAALAAGLGFASYHFLKHGSVAAQMEHYIATVRPADGERVVIDYEDADCTAHDLIEAVEWLLNNHPQLELTVYGARKLTDDVNANPDPILMQTSLWAARYSSSEPVIATAIWPHWSLWQFSQEGRVDGVNGDCDLNTFNGSAENCLKWLGPAGAEPPGPTPGPELVVSVTIQAPPGVTVKVFQEESA